jgi:parallel beta-helix repeat protein
MLARLRSWFAPKRHKVIAIGAAGALICGGGIAYYVGGNPNVSPPSSINATCSSDVTSALNAWLGTLSSGAQITFPSTACYEVNETLVLTNLNNVIVNGNGATFENTVYPTNNSIWEALDGSNITFENMTINGSDPTCAYNASYEWQYGVDYQATQGGTVNNVTVNNVGGDGVEAEYDPGIGAVASPPVTNLTIENSTVDCTGRMGIGLTDANGVTVNNNLIENNRWYGIDIEPDVVQEYASNITMTGNTFTNINFGLLSDGGPGYYPNNGNITFSNNIETTHPLTCIPPIQMEAPSGTYRYNYTVTGNTLYSYGDGIQLLGDDNMAISGNTVTFVTGGGCGGTPYGVHVGDSHTVSITSNSFPFYLSAGGGADYVDGLSTNVTASGNTTS